MNGVQNGCGSGQKVGGGLKWIEDGIFGMHLVLGRHSPLLFLISCIIFVHINGTF